MTHSFYQIDFENKDIINLGSCVRKNVNPQYIGAACITHAKIFQIIRCAIKCPDEFSST